MPKHNHSVNANATTGYGFNTSSNLGGISSVVVENSGGGQSHNNIPPTVSTNVWRRIA